MPPHCHQLHTSWAAREALAPGSQKNAFVSVGQYEFRYSFYEDMVRVLSFINYKTGKNLILSMAREKKRIGPKVL